MSTMKRRRQLELALQKTRSDAIETLRDKLVDEMESLSRRLAQEAKFLKEQSTERMINEGIAVNSLGEVQGAGLSIDLKCARLAEKVDSLGALRTTLNMLRDFDESERSE